MGRPRTRVFRAAISLSGGRAAELGGRAEETLVCGLDGVEADGTEGRLAIVGRLETWVLASTAGRKGDELGDNAVAVVMVVVTGSVDKDAVEGDAARRINTVSELIKDIKKKRREDWKLLT